MTKANGTGNFKLSIGIDEGRLTEVRRLWSSLHSERLPESLTPCEELEAYFASTVFEVLLVLSRAEDSIKATTVAEELRSRFMAMRSAIIPHMRVLSGIERIFFPVTEDSVHTRTR